MQRFICLSTANEIWNALLKTFYDGLDETCLFELNKKSFTTKQDRKPLSMYYNELVSIFQEIDHRTPSQEGTVEGVIQLYSAMARLRVHIFLGGLDFEFDQIRGEILRKDPKLDLESAYAYMRREHQQRQKMGSSRSIFEHYVMLASQTQSGSTKNRNSKLAGKFNNHVCDHFGESGHSKQRCYELLAILNGGIFRKSQGKRLRGKPW